MSVSASTDQHRCGVTEEDYRGAGEAGKQDGNLKWVNILF